jgi:hypothetical protein
MLANAKLVSSITFIVLASFTIVTYDRQNMFIIQATGHHAECLYAECHMLNVIMMSVIALTGKYVLVTASAFSSQLFITPV